jgi:PAS domain S-box-containing protein
MQTDADPETGSTKTGADAGDALSPEAEYWRVFRQCDFEALVFDLKDLSIVGVTTPLEARLGYGTAELEGRGLADIWPEEEVAWRKEFIRSTEVAGDSGSGLSVRFKRKDGTLFETEIRFRNTEMPGRTLRVVLFDANGYGFREISSRKVRST